MHAAARTVLMPMTSSLREALAGCASAAIRLMGPSPASAFVQGCRVCSSSHSALICALRTRMMASFRFSASSSPVAQAAPEQAPSAPLTATGIGRVGTRVLSTPSDPSCGSQGYPAHKLQRAPSWKLCLNPQPMLRTCLRRRFYEGQRRLVELLLRESLLVLHERPHLSQVSSLASQPLTTRRGTPQYAHTWPQFAQVNSWHLPYRAST